MPEQTPNEAVPEGLDLLEIPDRMRPVLGIRQFMVNSRGRVYSPNRRGYRWKPGEWLTARCSPGWRWERLEEPHRSPHPDCCCGIQVGYDFGSLWAEGTVMRNQGNVHIGTLLSGNAGGWDLSLRDDPGRKLVYGIVAATGFVRYCETLMKAEKVRLLALIKPPRRAGDKGLLEAGSIQSVAAMSGWGYEDLSRSGAGEAVMSRLAEHYNCDYVSRREILTEGVRDG